MLGAFLLSLIMPGETNLSTLLKTMKPELNAGDYVFLYLTLTGDDKPLRYYLLIQRKGRFNRNS